MGTLSGKVLRIWGSKNNLGKPSFQTFKEIGEEGNWEVVLASLNPKLGLEPGNI